MSEIERGWKFGLGFCAAASIFWLASVLAKGLIYLLTGYVVL